MTMLYLELTNESETVRVELTPERVESGLEKLFIIQPAVSSYNFDDRIKNRLSVKLFNHKWRNLLYKSLETMDCYGLEVYRVGDDLSTENQGYTAYTKMNNAIDRIINEVLEVYHWEVKQNA